MKNPIIYCYTDLETGKRYIGQTRYPEARDKGHRACLDDGWHYKLHTHPELFKYEILEHCDEEDLNFLEHYYIEAFDSVNNGYNKSHGYLTDRKVKEITNEPEDENDMPLIPKYYYAHTPHNKKLLLKIRLKKFWDKLGDDIIIEMLNNYNAMSSEEFEKYVKILTAKHNLEHYFKFLF